MKILHVGKYYPPVPGGMERVLQLLCEGERRHVDSRVLVAGTDRTTRREVRNGVPVTSSSAVSAALRRLLDEFRSSYVLHFVPQGVERGGFHTLTVRVTRSGGPYDVRARSGYEWR